MVPSICKGLLDAIGTRREQQFVSDTYRLSDGPTVTERPREIAGQTALRR
jgi:hypothetical protein